jgi:hypothetical protein
MTTNDPVGASRNGGAVEDPRDSIEDWLQEMSGIDHAPELKAGMVAPPPPAPGESPFDDPELDHSSPFDRLDRPAPEQRSEQQPYEPQGYDQQGYEQLGYDQQGYDQQGYERPGFEQGATAEHQAVSRPRHGYEVEPDDEPTGSWAFEVPRQSTGGGGGGRHRAEP